jgi:urease accessory protein
MGGMAFGVPAVAAGLLHPLVTPAHLIAMIGLGIFTGGRLRAPVVAAFALGLAGGLGAIAWGIGETPAADALLVVAALCGVAAAVQSSVPRWLPVFLALCGGAATGLDSPPEFIALGDAVLMLIGTACGGVIALVAISLAAAPVGRIGQGIALRVTGSWIAAIAILVLALRLAG